MRPKQIKPCCKKFRRVVGKYIDVTVDTDSTLRLTANLLFSMESLETLDPSAMRELGVMLENFLNRKVVLEHVFFDRSLGSCTFGEADLSTEIHRVHAKVRELGGLP